MIGDIKTNAAQFNATIQSFANRFSEEKIRKLVKKLAFDIWDEIGNRCPVDTGRAQTNFQLDTKLNNRTIETFSTARPAPPILEDSMVYWIFNNLDYIEALENGHSKQAPGGFIAPAIAEFNRVYEQRARELGFLK